MSTVQARQELLTFERKLHSWLVDHRGEYAVILGDSALHFAPDLERALEWAYARYEQGQVFVKKVSEDAAVSHFTRDLG